MQGRDGVEGGVDDADLYRHVPPPLDTPEGQRRRRQERRRRVTTIKNVLPAAAVLIALAIASRYEGGGTERVVPGPPGGPVVGAPAVWKLDPGRSPQSEARSFTALVSRVGCGEVGDVLPPQVIENPSSVTVIFGVTPVPTNKVETCAVDGGSPYSVRLKTPLGERSLFDGTCDLPPARTAPACVSAQRWPLQG